MIRRIISKGYYQRYQSSNDIVAYTQTIGEFEALLSGISSFHTVGNITVIMPKPFERDELLMANISLMVSLSDLKLKLLLQGDVSILSVKIGVQN